MNFHWPWTARPGGFAAPEAKQAPSAGSGSLASGWGFVALHAQGDAAWTRRDYPALAREGFMKNPVVHRAVRLIAEAAASAPWLLYEGEAELAAHPALDLLARPNQRQAGGSFFEALYGHLLLSGNAYVELVTAGFPSPSRGGSIGTADWGGVAGTSRAAATTPSGRYAAISPSKGDNPVAAELHLLRPDRVSVVTDSSGWPAALEHREGAGKRRIAPESGLHLTLFHPLDDHYGFPPLEAALMRSTFTMRQGAGTRRCSTIRRGPPARWSMRRRRAAT